MKTLVAKPRPTKSTGSTQIQVVPIRRTWWEVCEAWWQTGRSWLKLKNVWMLLASTALATALAFVWHWWCSTPEKLLPAAYERVEDQRQLVLAQLNQCDLHQVSIDPESTRSLAFDEDFSELLVDFAERVNELQDTCSWSSKVYERRALREKSSVALASSLKAIATVNQEEAAYWAMFSTGLDQRIRTFEQTSETLVHVHVLQVTYSANTLGRDRLAQFREDYDEHLHNAAEALKSIQKWLTEEPNFSDSQLSE